MTCTFHFQELLDIEEDLNRMESGLNLVESWLVIIMSQWKPM